MLHNAIKLYSYQPKYVFGNLKSNNFTSGNHAPKNLMTINLLGNIYIWIEQRMG